MSAEAESAVEGYTGKFGRESTWEFLQKPDWYEQAFSTYGDVRTTSRFLLATPEPALLIVALYLLFVWLGPRLMAKRQPMNLRPLIVGYNFVLVPLSAYMSFEFFWTARQLGYSYACQGIDWSYSMDPYSIRLSRVSWLFYISKIIELADTIFFILRKKNDQVSFLHVYHHSTMIINWWMAAKYLPVGQSFFVGMINSFIHALMYAYYGLAALGPSVQKYLWWKKYMTVLQLVQFVLVISHTGYNKFVRYDCDYPSLYNTIVFYYTISMVVLFSQFYYQTYVQQCQRRAKLTAGEGVKKTENNNGVKVHQENKKPEHHVGENGIVKRTAVGDVRDKRI